MRDESWAMKGELVLSCNCTVFCPCVLSLGNHPPTEGYCQTWAGLRIDSGHFGQVDLSGLNLGLIMEIPGYMSRGNWTAGLFVDQRAPRSMRSRHSGKIFSGKAGGTTSLLSILVGNVSRRRAGADHLRSGGQDPHLPDPEDHRWGGDTRCRQGTGRRHGHHQFSNTGSRRKSSSQKRKRVKCAPSAATGISRALRRNLQARLARTVKERRKISYVSRSRKKSHLAAGKGVFRPSADRVRLFPGFLSLVAASEERWTAMFWWLGLALFVDGIDGPIARKLEVKEILPTWSGELLDNIIDYVTYVLIPAFALYQRGFMGEGLSFLSAAIIVVSSAIYYADTGMKTKENFFKGFPVVWNMMRLHAVRHRARPVGLVRGRRRRRHPDLRADQFPPSGPRQAPAPDQPRRHVAWCAFGACAGAGCPGHSRPDRQCLGASRCSPRSASPSPASTFSASAASCSFSQLLARKRA